MAEKDDKPTPHSAAAFAREQEKPRSEAAKLADLLKQSTEDFKLRDRMGHALGLGPENVKLRKTSDQNLDLKDAMLKDLVKRGLNKTEFAHALHHNPNTVNWWFTNDHIPWNRQVEVVEFLGTNSLTFKILLHRARIKTLEGDRSAKATVYLLEGLREFNDFLNSEAASKADSLTKLIDMFENANPSYRTLANWKRKLIGAAVRNVRGEKSGSDGILAARLPIPHTRVELAKHVLKGSASGEVLRMRKLYFIGSEQEEKFHQMIDEFDWRSPSKPIPQARLVNKTGTNRIGVRVSTEDYLVSAIATPWMINPTRDGREENLPFLGALRATAFEMLMCKLDDEANGIKRDYLFIVFDPVELYKGSTWYDQFFDDVRKLGLIPMLDEELEHLHESMLDHVNRKNNVSSVVEDTYMQVDPEDDPNVGLF